MPKKGRPSADDFRRARASEIFTSQEVYKDLRRLLSNDEKFWLLDVDGDFTLYLSRLYELAHRYGVQVIHPWL